MRVRFAVPLLAILPSVVSADLYVKGQNERITVKASREPLARVLAGIARESGIAVVYQSPAPSHLVTISLDDVTPQEALIRLFDGQGLNYIFQLDATGSRVATLILAGTASASTRSASSPSSHSAPVPTPVYNEEEMPPEDEPEGDEEVMEQPPPEEVIQPEQAEPEKNLSGSAWTPPGVMAPPTTFPGAMPHPYPNQPGGQPNFPGGASGAGVPPQQQPPPQPRFPGGASQPQD
jgi:hypothetical protein